MMRTRTTKTRKTRTALLENRTFEVGSEVTEDLDSVAGACDLWRSSTYQIDIINSSTSTPNIFSAMTCLKTLSRLF